MTQSGVTPRLLNVEQFKRRINRNDPVANIYRNAIDLNRFSNAVAGQIVRDYNSIILSAVEDLRRIDLGVPTAGGGIVSPASVQAQRLRVLLAQLKESLDSWAERSTAYAAVELQGLAELQTEFVTDQLRLAVAGGEAGGRGIEPSVVAQQAVNTVEVAPNFAATVATVDPTDINFTLPGTGGFNLTAGQGAAITLPNGQVVEKAFRGLAESQAQRFNTTIRTGILAGEPTPQIARRLVGNLDFGQLAKTAKQQALAGGELIKMADHQVLTVVRTSVQQVANTASQNVYQANQDVTKKYRYVATLDSRTSAICRSLDGKEYVYGKGPQPPVHFNCLPGDARVSTSGRIAAVYRRPYQGFLYVIKTTDGDMLRVTPNHPVLTDSGWKTAQSIDVGDKVFRRNFIPSEAFTSDQKDQIETTAEDVFSAFRESPFVFAVEVPISSPDFHGDVSAEQVAVVLANRELLLTVNPGLLQVLENGAFQRADSASAGIGHSAQSFVAVETAAFGGMSGGNQGLSFGGSSTCHSGGLLLASVSELAPRPQNDALYGTWRDVELLSDPLDSNPAVVQGNNAINVAWVGREPFSGHVYNFETETGLYWADSILTHNCRSTTIPIVDYRALGLRPPEEVIGEGTRAAEGGRVSASTNYGQWLQKQPRAYQEEVLGKSRAAYFDRLSQKFGPQQALSRMVREDGSEVPLRVLQERYGSNNG
jgi:SPP1 gp7 family putative phage head morphogenesis protein